jgi:hypothetical protein
MRTVAVADGLDLEHSAMTSNPIESMIDCLKQSEHLGRFADRTCDQARGTTSEHAIQYGEKPALLIVHTKIFQ